MNLWKQAGVALGLTVAAVCAAAAYVPATHPMLDRIGLLAPLEAMRIVATGDGATEGASGGPPGGPPGMGGAALVIAAAPEPRAIEDIVTAIGTARGARSVVLAAEVQGRVTSVNVSAGDYVEAGDVIAELDSEAARIAVDRAALVLRDAEVTRDRVLRLQSSGSATDLQVQEAELAVQTAEIERRTAEYDLARHVIVAPIDGWIGILTAEVGNQLTLDGEVARIEDRSSLLIDFRVPERVVGRVTLGDPVIASPLAEPTLDLDGEVSALDNRVDETSRSLRLQATVDNSDDRLRPGMAVMVSLAFQGQPRPAVDPLAIQWGADGAFVWIVRDGRAQRQPVRVLQRTNDVVLISMDDAQPGDLVVSEGVQNLRPGLEVQLAPAGPPEEPKT